MSSADLSGTLSGGRHTLSLRVYYEDTDFSAVVYHASYLRFMERGRTEFLRALGVEQGASHAGELDLAFVVRRMAIDFLKPARMDDIVKVDTRISRVGGASVELSQRVLRGQAVLVTADVTIAAVVNGRATRLPARLRARFRDTLSST